MLDFLINIEHDARANVYQAVFSSGRAVVLDATNYADAVCEADFLVSDDHE